MKSTLKRQPTAAPGRSATQGRSVNGSVTPPAGRHPRPRPAALREAKTGAALMTDLLEAATRPPLPPAALGRDHGGNLPVPPPPRPSQRMHLRCKPLCDQTALRRLVAKE